MDNFKANTEAFFKKHNIKTDVTNGKDVLDKKVVKASDILFGNKQDKQINKMSDIFNTNDLN